MKVKHLLKYFILLYIFSSTNAQNLLSELNVTIKILDKGVSAQPNTSKLIVKSIVPDLSFESNKGIIKVDMLNRGEWVLTLYPGNQRLEIKSEGFISYSERITFEKQRIYECQIRKLTTNDINDYDVELFEAVFVYNIQEVFASINDYAPIQSTKNRSIFKVPAGEYTFHFKKTGYEPYSESIQIEDDIYKTIDLVENISNIEIYQTPGIVLINSEPADAEVIFDGQKVGNTPTTITGAAPGQHQLGLIKSKYFTEQRLIELGSGEIKNVDIVLAPNFGFVNVFSYPDSCMVLLNDKVIGMTPVENLPIESGKYTLLGRKNLYHDYTLADINITNQDTTFFEFQLEPAFGILNINTESVSGAQVYINREFLGNSPIENYKYPSGTYEIKINKQFYHEINEDIVIADSKNINRIFFLMSNFGTLKITGNAEKIVLNDKQIEDDFGDIRLLPGRYTVHAELKNHYPQTQEITIYNEMTERINFDLLPKLGSLTVLVDSTLIFQNSKVVIDSINVGSLPLIKTLIVGDYQTDIYIDNTLIIKDIKIAENRDTPILISEEDLITARMQAAKDTEIDLSTLYEKRLPASGNRINVNTIPNLIGMNLDEAKTMLAKNNIALGEILYVEQKRLKDKITLTYPLPGTELDKRGKLILVVGQ
ncbi:PEGA domain-containing protein [Candidatus Neomarinimicrobiota bacterium]